MAAKQALQQRLGLKTSDLPLVGIITRLTHQKGIHLIKHAIWRALERGGQVIFTSLFFSFLKLCFTIYLPETFCNCQVVLLGSAPDPRIQNEFVNLANELHSTHGDRARLCLTYDEPLSHLVHNLKTFLSLHEHNKQHLLTWAHVIVDICWSRFHPCSFNFRALWTHTTHSYEIWISTCCPKNWRFVSLALVFYQ